MSVINFGKYKGTEVSKVSDYGYLAWIIKHHREQDSNGNGFKIPDDIAAEAKAILDNKEKSSRSTKVEYTKPTVNKADVLKEVISAVKDELDNMREKEQEADGGEMKMFYLGAQQSLSYVLDILES